MNGKLSIVATPIGHMDDMTFRAVTTLKEADVIAAEDTRHTKKLLSHYHISTKCIALHDHNESARTEQLLALLADGQHIALVSDAGTPLISDPGFKLVRSVQAAGFQVTPIPGACAAIAALSVSGLPTDQFAFRGFLPAKGEARRKAIAALANEQRTTVLYESPRRLKALVATCCELLDETRLCVLARELTKQFETVHQATLSEMLTFIDADANQARGECVFLLAGQAQGDNQDALNALVAALSAHMPVKQAIQLVADHLPLNKNAAYDFVLNAKKR